MPPFILCPECAKVISIYHEFISKAIEAINNNTLHGKNSQYDNYKPEKIVLDDSILPPMEDLFNALGITNRCCRMRLFTYTDIDLNNSIDVK